MSEELITKLIAAARAYGEDVSIDTCNREMEAEDALRAELSAQAAEIARLRSVMQKAVDNLFEVNSVSNHSEWMLMTDAKRWLHQALLEKRHDEAPEA